MKNFLASAVIIMCGMLNDVSAQTVPEKQPSPEWWLRSAKADSVERYLFHIEGTIGYSKMTGSTVGETHTGGGRAALRKNAVTLKSVYRIDKMSMSFPAMGLNYSSESQLFSTCLDVDVTPLLYGEIGGIWERDNTIFIKNRYSAYAGAGLNGMVSEKHFLDVLLAVGRIDQNYFIPVDGVDVVKGAYSAFYARQQYKLTLDERFSFVEQATYLTNLSYAKRYRISASLDVVIGILRPVSLVFGFTYKFDKESELLGAIATNTTQNIGIRVSW
jgi:hypothetical protein